MGHGGELLYGPPLNPQDGNRIRNRRKVEQGPVRDTRLLTGERVAVTNRRVLNQKGRCVVRTRIVGAASFGWLDAAKLWGASVKVLVTRGGKLKNIAHQLYPDVLLAPPSFAIDLPPHRHWDGSVLTTIADRTQDSVERSRGQSHVTSHVIHRSRTHVNTSQLKYELTM